MTTTHKQYQFTQTHEWLDPSSNPLTVGITEHAQNLLGDIVFIELPKLHSTVKAGQELGVLESVKAAADYYAPIAGVISEINPAVQENPSLINQDPFGAGWICKITPLETSNLNHLLTEDAYLKLIAE
jgi:glycine cleavage system H protein